MRVSSRWPEARGDFSKPKLMRSNGAYPDGSIAPLSFEAWDCFEF